MQLMRLKQQATTVGSENANGQILVMSFDTTNAGLNRYIKPARLHCDVECNPLHGPRAEELIEKLLKLVKKLKN